MGVVVVVMPVGNLPPKQKVKVSVGGTDVDQVTAGKKKGQKSAASKKKSTKSKGGGGGSRKANSKSGQPYAGNDLTAKLFATMEKHKDVSTAL